MSRFLFVTWEGGGHVQPMLLVARGLIERGHQALAISDAVNETDANALGVPFRAWRRAPSRTDREPESDPVRDYLAKTPLAVIERLCDRLIAGPAALYGADVVEAIEAFGPDVVVPHELLFGAMAGAEARHVRLAPLSANVWSLPTLACSPPFGGGLPAPVTEFDFSFYRDVRNATRKAFQHGLPALNAARAQFGLAPLADLFDQLDAAGRILIATSRAFDFDLELPDPYRYVGPYFEDPGWTVADWDPPWPAADQRPVALVSFSTMYQGQDEALQRVIDALGGLDVRGIVTLGPGLTPADYPAPDNVTVVARAPHAKILPIAAVAITHAGHASALRPLMAGLPVVALPLGRDQPDNAIRISERGAGVRLPADASAADIAEAVRKVLGDPAYRAAAAALGARIRADADARDAEQTLIDFAQEPS